MTISSELFLSAAREAEKILYAHGYVMHASAQKKSSAGFIAEYTKADDVFSLTWNDAQKSLALVSKGHSGTQELLYRGLRDANADECERAMQDALRMMSEYFSPHRHDDDDENICGCAHHHA